MTVTRKALLAALRAVQAYVEDGTHCEFDGICGNVRTQLILEDVPWDALGKAEGDLRAAFKTWPMFSGYTLYPVPGNAGRNPYSMYFQHADVIRDLWVGEYGERRKDLLRHCIEYFSEDADA